MARALFEARRAPGTEVELDPIEAAFSQLDDRLVGPGREAVVALVAIAAGEAPRRLVTCLALREASHDFVEARAFLHRQLGVLAPIGIEEHGEVEELVRDQRML